MGYWKSKFVPTMKKLFEKKKAPVEEKSQEVVEVVGEVIKSEEPAKVEETKPVEVKTGEKEIEEKKEEVTPSPVPVPAAKEEKKPAVEEVKKDVVTATPVAETLSTKAPETSPVVEPVKPPETPPRAEPKKARGFLPSWVSFSTSKKKMEGKEK